MSYLEHNLKVIRKIDPALAGRIESCDTDSCAVDFLPSRINGMITAKVWSEGREGFIHSAYDPVAESVKWVNTLEDNGEDKVIIFGFGLGYHVEQFFKKNGTAKTLLVVEPSLELFKKVLAERDLSVLLAERIILSVGEEKIPFERKLVSFFRAGDLDAVKVEVFPSYFRLFQNSYQELRTSCHEAIRRARITENTLLFFSQLWPENIFKNLSDIVKNPGVKALFGKAHKKPGIIISAGPSLNKNRHLLKEAKGKAVLICVDTALRSLLKENIKPDLVVALDGSELNYRHFEGIRVEDVPLVFLPTTHYKILQEYSSPKFSVQCGNSLVNWIGQYVEDKGALSFGGSVATAAFSLAVSMDCDPVIFVGQDLSYPGGKSHADGTIFEERVVHDTPDKISVEDIYGNKVLTDVSMHSFLKWFEHAIDNHGNSRQFVDATEGGARIKGTEILTLREVIDRYCTEPVDIQSVISDIFSYYKVEDLSKLADALADGSEALKRLEKLGHKGFEYAREFYKEYEKQHISSNRVAKLVKKMDNVDRSLKEEQFNKFLNIMLQPILLSVIKGPLAHPQEGETEKQKGLRVAQRSLMLYRGIQEAAEIMKELVDNALKEITA